MARDTGSYVNLCECKKEVPHKACWLEMIRDWCNSLKYITDKGCCQNQLSVMEPKVFIVGESIWPEAHGSEMSLWFT